MWGALFSALGPAAKSPFGEDTPLGSINTSQALGGVNLSKGINSNIFIVAAIAVAVVFLIKK